MAEAAVAGCTPAPAGTAPSLDTQCTTAYNWGVFTKDNASYLAVASVTAASAIVLFV